eukprot:2307004-Amphidinium_carterae.1
MGTAAGAVCSSAAVWGASSHESSANLSVNLQSKKYNKDGARARACFRVCRHCRESLLGNPEQDTTKRVKGM